MSSRVKVLPSDRLWTREDVAAYLRVSVRTVQRLGPPRVPGLTLKRYDPQTVKDWAAGRGYSTMRAS